MIPKPLLQQIKKHILANGIRSKTLIGYDQAAGFSWIVDVDDQGKLSRQSLNYMSFEEYNRRQEKLQEMAVSEDRVIESQLFGELLH